MNQAQAFRSLQLTSAEVVQRRAEFNDNPKVKKTKGEMETNIK